MDNYYIFNLIREQKFKNIIKLIKKNKIINLDIRDNNYNYFIQYIINYNQKELLELILEMYVKNKIKIRIDILDNDGRSILYNCIKFNYINLINILIEKYNNIVIGISILDIKDKLGFTALHYTIIFNNFEAFKILLTNIPVYIDPALNRQHKNRWR
jgi:ankyrin repeat protein